MLKDLKTTEEEVTKEIKNVSSSNPTPTEEKKGIASELNFDKEEIKKEKRGRKPKEDSTPPREKIFITPIVNDTVIPFASKKFKKKKEDLEFTTNELNLLNQLQPVIYADESSWPIYIVTSCAILIGHYFNAETIKIESEIQRLEKKINEFKNEGEVKKEIKKESAITDIKYEEVKK